MTTAASGTTIRILVADDHPIVRDGLIAVLNTQPDFAIVGEAGTGAEALRLIAALAPDVALLDLEMPESDGVEALRWLQREGAPTRVIVFTAFGADDRILAALQAGAQGYLLKGAPRDDIFRAIRTVFAGGSLLAPVVASRLLRHVAGAASAEQVALTPREQETLRLLGQGLQNKEIAARLGVRERTAKFHLAALMRKLGAGNRTEVVTLASQRGLLSLAPNEGASGATGR